MGDPWADEGFGGEDDWEGKESVESDEDEDEDDDEELEGDEDDTAGDT